MGGTHAVDGRALTKAPRPREEVAVAGPPFVVIVMALRSNAPPFRACACALKEAISTRPASNQGKHGAKDHMRRDSQSPKPVAAYASEMIIRRWWRGPAHHQPIRPIQATPTSRRLLWCIRGSLVACPSIAGPCQ